MGRSDSEASVDRAAGGGGGLTEYYELVSILKSHPLKLKIK